MLRLNSAAAMAGRRCGSLRSASSWYASRGAVGFVHYAASALLPLPLPLPLPLYPPMSLALLLPPPPPPSLPLPLPLPLSPPGPCLCLYPSLCLCRCVWSCLFIASVSVSSSVAAPASASTSVTTPAPASASASASSSFLCGRGSPHTSVSLPRPPALDTASGGNSLTPAVMTDGSGRVSTMFRCVRCVSMRPGVFCRALLCLLCFCRSLCLLQSVGIRLCDDKSGRRQVGPCQTNSDGRDVRVSPAPGLFWRRRALRGATEALPSPPPPPPPVALVLTDEPASGPSDGATRASL